MLDHLVGMFAALILISLVELCEETLQLCQQTGKQEDENISSYQRFFSGVRGPVLAHFMASDDGSA